MKRIFLEMAKLKNPNSGLGQFCLNLGQELRNQSSSSVELYFYLPATQREAFGSANVIPQSAVHKIIAPNSSRFDVWHCLHQDSPYLPRNRHTKLLITIHDLNFLYKYSGLKRRLKLQKLQRKVNRADAITVISKFTESSVREHLNVGNKPIRVIPNGNPIAKITQATKPDFINFEQFLFTIGIISPKKNFHVLLPLLVKNPKLHLVIGGDDQSFYANDLKAQAKAMGVQNRIHFPGSVTGSQKLWLYQNCMAFVFPALSEGFGLPVVEAMSVGAPVFLSKLTSLPEVGGPEAFYWENFDPDHMNNVFTQGIQSFNPAHAERSRNWAKQFSWEAAAREYLKFYQEL